MVYLPHWPIPATLGNRKIDYETVFERMALVLEKLGNPQEKLPPVIHVAGTNGKGSATSLISEIFTQAGYKTHIYTSPHLHDCNERIVLAGEKISDNFLFEIMEETRIAAAEIPLTFMESFTIGAFLAFAKTPADVAVIECGMGGRIDATNIIQKKLATVIMPISFDHTEYLGNSIERIALEKAMIMRPTTPLIVASQPKKAREIIEILAVDQNVKTYFYDEDFAVIMDEESGEFDLRFEDKIFENLPRPALLGSHQYINFATAIAAVLAVTKNFKISESHIRQAIKNVYWPSRLERISLSFDLSFDKLRMTFDKLRMTSGSYNKTISHAELKTLSHTEPVEAWIDGAHNEAGAFALARFILEQNDEKENFIICGFSRGKCKKEFLEKFKNIAEVVAVRVNGEPYPESSERIREVGAEINMEIFAAQDLLEAIYYISEKTAAKPCRIIICGSLHLARDVRKFLS